MSYESFVEEQRLMSHHVWLWLLILPAPALAWWALVQQIVLHHPFGNHPGPDWTIWVFWALFGIGLPLLLWAVRLTFKVDSEAIQIAYFPFLRRRLLFRDIVSCEACEYQPLSDYGGWGIRWGWKGMIFSASGNKGVRLGFRNGKQLMLGTRMPDELALAIQRGMRDAARKAGTAG